MCQAGIRTRDQFENTLLLISLCDMHDWWDMQDCNMAILRVKNDRNPLYIPCWSILTFNSRKIIWSSSTGWTLSLLSEELAELSDDCSGFGMSLQSHSPCSLDFHFTILLQVAWQALGRERSKTQPLSSRDLHPGRCKRKIHINKHISHKLWWVTASARKQNQTGHDGYGRTATWSSVSSGRLRRDKPAGPAGSLRGLQLQTRTPALLKGCRWALLPGCPSLGIQAPGAGLAWTILSLHQREGARGGQEAAMPGHQARAPAQVLLGGLNTHGRGWPPPQGREHLKTSVLPVGEGLCGSRC